MIEMKAVVQTSLLTGFQNGTTLAQGRAFHGMRAPHSAQVQFVDPRRAVHLSVGAGDTLALTALDSGMTPVVVAVSPDGQDALPSFGLPAGADLDLAAFDSAEFAAWVDANGGRKVPQAAAISTPDDVLVLSATQTCDVWVVNPAPRTAHVAGSATGAFRVHIQRAATSAVLLPDPLGEIREEFTVSRATAQSYRVNKGEYVQIIDVAGQQCSDFMAFRTAGLDAGQEHMIDSTVTRSMVGGAYPGPGLFDKFFDQNMRPLLNVVQDTVGRHDTFALACTARGYEERGFPGHVNCSDNISHAMDPYGVAARPAWPAINFFFNSWIDHADNRIQSEESWSRPGDYVAMRAMDDLVCVTTACPDDVDPINGWNPTDVHVRIYKEQAPIRRAVAYREKEDAPMTLSQNSAFHPATSKLTTQYAPARDLWLPSQFPGAGTLGEYWACRNAVTIQDLSGLRKYDVLGPDAEKLLQKATTRNVAKLPVWRGHYTLMCDDHGVVIDDGTLFRLAPDVFRWCCGTEESARHLTVLAQGMDVRIHDMRSALPNLAIQGPKSRDVMRKLAFTQPHVPRVDDMRWFGATVARVGHREGAPFMLARAGYTGELGYEVFCAPEDAVGIWDAIMDAGQDFGIEPMGGHALDIIRIEAGLAAANAEFAADVDAWEAGLGFAVDMAKSDFVGRAALERNKQTPRRVLKGMLMDSDDVPSPGAHVYDGERPVGVVTSATRSPMLERAIAMVRLSVGVSDVGTALEVGQMDGHMKRLSGTVCDVPFIDPTRARARA